MNFNAPIPAWAVLLMVVALTALVLYFAFVAHRNAVAAEYTIERLARKHDEARGELDAAQQHNAILEDANKNILLKGEEWQKLYGELLNTLHDLQGDAHATAPLQEATPAPVKRTRKKAGAQ